MAGASCLLLGPPGFNWVALDIANQIDPIDLSIRILNQVVAMERSAVQGGVVGASHVTCSKKLGVNNISMQGVQNLFLQHGGVCETSMRISG